MTKRKNTEKIIPTSIRLPSDFMREVRDAARAEERTVTAFIIRALRVALAKSKQEMEV